MIWPPCRVALRLVVETELAAFERVPQARLQREALERVGVERLGVELEVVLALELGLVHRDVGVLRERLLVLPVRGMDRDADARRDADLVPHQRERSGDRREHVLRHRRRVPHLRHFGQQRDELVSAQARHGVAAAQAGRKPPGDLLQQLVAGFVSERVIDLLEAVEVEEEQRELPVVATRLGDALIQQLGEEAPIRQSGEPVVVREVFDALRVGEAGVALLLAAQRELPAQAAEHRHQDEHHDAAGDGPPDVDARAAIHRRVLLGLGQADDHHQGELEEQTGYGVARHVIPRILLEDDADVFRVLNRDQRGVVDGVARGDRLAGASDAEHAVGSEDSEEAVVAQLGGFVAAHEVGRVDGELDDAGKGAVGRVEAQAEVERPVAGVPPATRAPDYQGVGLARRLEVLLAGDVDSRRPRRARDDIAAGVLEGDDEEQLRRQQRPRLELREGDLPAAPLVRVLHELQGLVDFAQRAHDLRFVGLRQLQRRIHRGGLHGGALDREQLPRHSPDQSEQHDAEERQQQVRLGELSQPTMEPAERGSRGFADAHRNSSAGASPRGRTDLSLRRAGLAGVGRDSKRRRQRRRAGWCLGVPALVTCCGRGERRSGESGPAPAGSGGSGRSGRPPAPGSPSGNTPRRRTRDGTRTGRRRSGRSQRLPPDRHADRAGPRTTRKGSIARRAAAARLARQRARRRGTRARDRGPDGSRDRAGDGWTDSARRAQLMNGGCGGPSLGSTTPAPKSAATAPMTRADQASRGSGSARAPRSKWDHTDDPTCPTRSRVAVARPSGSAGARSQASG